MNKRTQKRGFTIVELIVVIGIIMMILSILFVSIAEVRKNSRDKTRLADLSSIEYAFNLYKEKNRNYPIYDGGVEIGVGEPIDGDLGVFWPRIIADPSSTGQNSEYGYWYDSAFDCGGTERPVVLIRKFEKSGSGNYEEVCGSSSQADTDSYALIKKAYAGYSQGSYYSQANYYQQGDYYSQSTYYDQGGYYSQSTYYNQGSYYFEAAYSSQLLELSAADYNEIYIIPLD